MDAPVSDVGRRFIAERVVQLEIILDEGDVLDQLLSGETAYESAFIIAGSTPIEDWTIVNEEVVER